MPALPFTDTTLALLRWTLLAFFFVAGPLADRVLMKRLRRFTSETQRLRWLRATIVTTWPAAIAAIVLAWPADLMRVPMDAGSLVERPGIHAVLVAVVAVFFALVIGGGLRCIGQPERRRRAALGARPLRFMMPVSRRERAWWLAVSITAGVCEEIVTRGFLLQLLAGRIPGGFDLPVLGACVVSTLVFGLAHAYQGIAGIARTSFMGLMLGLLAILTGSLVLPILVHVLADAQLLWIYRPLVDDPQEARRLVEGCVPDAAASPAVNAA